MRIERVDLLHLQIPLVGHFETSYGRRHESTKLLLEVHTADFVAYTECVAGPVPAYSYESIGTAREVLISHLLPAVMGRDLAGPQDFWGLCGRFRGHPMAKAALENALWILRALEEDVSLARLLGNRADRVTSGVSIGIQDSPEALVDLVGSYLDQGYPRIKMKIKQGADVDRVAAVRDRFPDITLMVDANNAYSLADMDVLRALDGYDLQMIEQPLAYDDIFEHAKVQAALRTPICLDESIHTPEDARLAIELGSCRIINIKQGRVAGLARAVEIHDLCREAGIGVWCGGMFETGVGRAVLVALAGLPNFVYPNDISASDRYYPRDIVDPQFELNRDGTIDVPRGPGLGVQVNAEVLERYLVTRETIKL